MKLSLPPHTILLPSPVLVIGTYGPDDRSNIMTAAWGGIASSKPPCISVSLREATLTYHNIRQANAFTVNFPSEKHVKEADYVGIVSGREHDKFQGDRIDCGKEQPGQCPDRQRISLCP